MRINHFKIFSIDNEPGIDFSFDNSINVIKGKPNSGKSAILYAIQNFVRFDIKDVPFGKIMSSQNVPYEQYSNYVKPDQHILKGYVLEYSEAYTKDECLHIDKEYIEDIVWYNRAYNKDVKEYLENQIYHKNENLCGLFEVIANSFFNKFGKVVLLSKDDIYIKDINTNKPLELKEDLSDNEYILFHLLLQVLYTNNEKKVLLIDDIDKNFDFIDRNELFNALCQMNPNIQIICTETYYMKLHNFTNIELPNDPIKISIDLDKYRGGRHHKPQPKYIPAMG